MEWCKHGVLTTGPPGNSQDFIIIFVVVVQSLSHVWFTATPWTPAHQAPLSFTISRNWLRFMFIESVYLTILSSANLILLFPSVFPSIRVFSSESDHCVRWPNYWHFSFSISPFNEHLGLISFRIEWLDLLEDQGSLKSILPHHSSKASIRLHLAFFIVQLSHPYMTTGKTIALISQTFVGNIMSLLFNTLSRLVIALTKYNK